MRDNAIVAYAETKVMEKSDRDVWVLSGEILEALLDKTGIEKNEIDGLVMAGLTGTGAANRSGRKPRPTCWASRSASASRSTPAAARRRAASPARLPRSITGCARSRSCLFADTHVLEDNGPTTATPTGANGPTPTACWARPARSACCSRAYEAKYGLDYRMLGKLAVTQRNHALMNENACEKLRVPITIDDYMNSRMIADPIRLLDCVMRPTARPA